MAVVSGISTPSLTTTLATASNDKMTIFLISRAQKISLDIRLVPIEKVFPGLQCHHNNPHSQ